MIIKVKSRKVSGQMLHFMWPIAIVLMARKTKKHVAKCYISVAKKQVSQKEDKSVVPPQWQGTCPLPLRGTDYPLN